MTIRAELFDPIVFRRFERIGVIEDVESVFDLIREGATQMDIGGHMLPLNSLRLQTFASSELCCSNPECTTKPEYFVIERTTDNDHPEFSKYHLNLYGTDHKGRETLFTHDHTLARALGGGDQRDNTTLMCAPCNFRKARMENNLVNQKREEDEKRNDPEGYALRRRLEAARKLKVATQKLDKLLRAAPHFFQKPIEDVVNEVNAQAGDVFVDNGTAYAQVGLTPQGYKNFSRTMAEFFQTAKQQKRNI